MNIKTTPLDGVFEIQNSIYRDHRGDFVKIFNFQVFRKYGLENNFKESFYSVSHENVLRGMHFQEPPHDHAKLVYVIEGRILDVVVDIRRKSRTFGHYYATELSSEDANSLYVGRGFAHGFLTLSKKAIVTYLTTSVHVPEFDKGVRWDSFGCFWDNESPVLSDRDKRLPSLHGLDAFAISQIED